MMIYSFGSGFSLESDDSDYLDNIRDDIAYAHWNGIEVTSLLVGYRRKAFSQLGWGLRPDSAISTCEACLDGRQPEFRLLCLRLVRPPAQQDPRLPPAHRTFNAGDRWAVWRVLATNTEFSNILLQLLLQKHQP